MSWAAQEQIVPEIRNQQAYVARLIEKTPIAVNDAMVGKLFDVAPQ